ncbi:MAG: GHKL domain-containing protein [Eubacterium sp.]|nr:GHKL domain-containing protein [Eubacterium sp.]
MDTKWKKFKYSSGNKLLCVLLAFFMVAVLMTNVIQLAKFIEFYGDDVFKKETTSFYETRPFENMLSRSFYSLQYDLTSNAREKEKQKYIDSFYAAYKKAAKKNRVSEAEKQKIISSAEEERQYYYDDYVDYDYDEVPDESYLYEIWTDGKHYYRGNDGNYYTKYMSYKDQSLKDAADSEYNIDFGWREKDARSLISDYYDQHKAYGVNYGTDYAYLKNIQFYAVHKDGTVITNVEKNTKAFVQSVKNGEGDSIVFEGAKGGYSASGALKDASYEYFYSPNKDFSVYVQIDPEFEEDDYSQTVYQNYLDAESMSFNAACINILVAFVLMIALAVVSCRLAGHKDGELSMAKIDKMPMDLHFALMGTAVGFAGFGVGALVVTFSEFIFDGWNHYGSNDFDILFYQSGWLTTVVCICSMLIWLMILGFATSLSRAVKCDYPVFSKLLVVRIIVLIFKVLKWIIKGIAKVIIRMFKGSGKFIKLILTFALRPKKLHKLSAPAVVLYTLFNFVSLGIIVLLFMPEDAFATFCGFLGIPALLGIDAFMVYQAVKYMKSLDDIITASEKGEPLPYNTDQLPQSLKVLADSLESTNAQLQQAVIKAVKDERTKTELITNVSHDLKTPLTSVINYINLLEKCDIYDEDAKKYMAVIAEKSNKLKRLIEDLIEASKVSTGNVTINKTLLNLNELATQAVVEETADIEKNNLHIIFEEAADKHIVMADGTKVYRVFENLLSNARKYSAPGSRIYARVYSDMNYGYFEIKNMSKEPLNISADELTERFVRGDKSRSQDGNGLGLSIAKELCKLNNGELMISIDGDLFKATVKLPKQ